MQESGGYYREMPTKQLSHLSVQIKQMQYCALVSNPQAGWTVRGHYVKPSRLQNLYFYLTAEVFDIYSALPLGNLSTYVAKLVGSQMSELPLKQTNKLCAWLTG